MLNFMAYIIKHKGEFTDMGKVAFVAISTFLVGIYNQFINTFLVNFILAKVSTYDTVIDEVVHTGTALSVALGVVYVGIKIYLLLYPRKKKDDGPAN